MPMPEPAIRLVAIDDDPSSLELIAAALEQDGLEILTEMDAEKGWELVRRIQPEIVMLDLVMPRVTGMDLLARIRDWNPTIDVILLTAHYSTDSAVDAIKKGACDYLTKPISIPTLRARLGGLLAEARRRRRALELEDQLLETCRFQNIVGRSAHMVEVFARIRRVAPHFRHALITGPTGTGKELVAHALHNLSPVAAGPFVVCNCSAVVETLFESELFGHVKGAFTGASQDRMGVFEYANGGTLFLDEIGDTPLATQSKLLRALQNQEIQRVGSPAVRRVDVRVVTATNRDLRAMIAEKRFREDLYYRLVGVEIDLPSLTQRAGDLPLLVQHFIKRFAKEYNKPVRNVSRRAIMVLSRYSWPGNIRELENVLSNACMMLEGEIIDVRDLPTRLLEPTEGCKEDGQNPLTLAEVDRRHVQRVLESVDGNKLKAARILGISRDKLYRILAEAESGAHSPADGDQP
jgi:DNA-binding NtrC family response regulator